MALEAESQITVPRINGRKGSTKVRTGCLTCKVRRLKCDETKPSCLRCVKTGRKCDGYAPPKGSARRPAPNPIFTLDASPESEPSLPRSPASSDWELGEQRAFSFYRHCSGTSLFSEATSPVWNNIIPAICHQEPAIRHAVFVISHLHETRYRDSRASQQSLSPFAAFHYGKALRSLQQWRAPEGRFVGTVANTVPLLACALFVCIEFMMGNNTAARMHIDQGRQLLSSYDLGPNNTPTSDFLKNHLAPIFSKMTLSSVVLGGEPTPIPLRLRITGGKGGVRMPREFDNAADAARAFYEVADDSLASGKEARLWVHQDQGPQDPTAVAKGVALRKEKRRLEDLFQQWHKAVQRSGLYDGPITKVALCYYHQACIFTGTSMNSRETAFDNYVFNFSMIVDLCTELLEAQDQDIHFRFDMGILPPLYITTIKCRHAGIRRASLSLLRRLAARGFKENSWDAQQITNIAARVVMLEEEHRAWPSGVSRIGHAAETAYESVGTSGHHFSDWDDMAIPESARVKNAVIGPHDRDGAWATFFMQIGGVGSGWTIFKEYISASAQGDSWGQHVKARATESKSTYVPFHVYATDSKEGMQT